MRFVVLLLIAAAVVVADDSPCSCERTAALEDEVAMLKREVRELRFLATELQPLKKLLARAGAETIEAVTVDTERGTVTSVDVGRRLSSAGSTYVSVPSRQVHEFPASHSCSNVVGDRGFMQVLPVLADGSVSWEESPTATANISLVLIDDDWTTNTIDTMPETLRIVHDPACEAAPTLVLPLDTEVAGTLTVGGAPVLTAGTGVDLVTLSTRVDAALAIAGLAASSTVPPSWFSSWTVQWNTESTATGTSNPESWSSDKKCDDQTGAQAQNSGGPTNGFNPYDTKNGCREFCSQSARVLGYTGSFCCSYKNNGGTIKCALSAEGSTSHAGGSNWYTIRGHIQ